MSLCLFFVMLLFLNLSIQNNKKSLEIKFMIHDLEKLTLELAALAGKTEGISINLGILEKKMKKEKQHV